MSRRIGLIAALGIIVASCSAPDAGATAPAAETTPPVSTGNVEPVGSPEVLDLSAWPEDEFWMQVVTASSYTGTTLRGYIMTFVWKKTASLNPGQYPRNLQQTQKLSGLL